MKKTRNIVVAILFAAFTASLGCAAMQETKSDWPAGVPERAAVIGGGYFDELALPADGLLYVVDGETGNVLQTMQVEAGRPIEMEMGEKFMAAFLINRYGLEETAEIMRDIQGDGDEQEHADEDEDEDEDEGEIGDDAASFVLYFIPMDQLGLIQD